jgi:hypothetical protein
MWIWKQYGIHHKMEVTSSEGTYTVEYKNIVFNSVTTICLSCHRFNYNDCSGVEMATLGNTERCVWTQPFC